jgi:hypothetical protein
MSDCQHREINAWFFEDGEAAGMYSCASCGVKFVPITELMTAENELAAAKAECEALREVLKLYVDAGIGSSTCFATQHDAWRLARAALAKEKST